MPVYLYEASDRAGRKTRTTAEARDENSLKESLRQKGLVPIKISPFEAKKSFFLEKATKKDLLNFTSELGSLLNAGLPLDRALFVLSGQTGKAEMRQTLKEIYIDIQKGQSLSQALSRHKIFPKMYVNMIKAGEAGGILEQVMKRLYEFLQTTSSFKEEVVSALIYPALLVVVSSISVAVLIMYVIPKFSVIFEDMGQSLPTSTLVLLKTSNFLVQWWWAVSLGLSALIAASVSYSKTSEGREAFDSMKMKVPLLRSLHVKFAVARFSRTLGTLLQSGVPVLEAVRISREVIGNEVMSSKLLPLEEGIKKGRGIASPLKETGVFPATVLEMITVGEEAGRLEDTFLLVAERFEAESRSTLKRLVSLMEPALILTMGLVVGFIVISMLLAVFSLNDLPL